MVGAATFRETVPNPPMIPVTIVSGFLGAGKTTLLNNLLRNRLGVRIGVIINDFGAINVDAMLVAGQVDSTLTLSNGCLCCALGDNDLAELLGTLAAGDIDAIVIEASGVAEPVPLVRMVLAASAADTRICYGGLVAVVDTVEHRATATRHPEIDQHLSLADMVVLNKIDVADAGELTHLRALVGELNPRAAVVEAVEAAVDPRLLFDQKQRPEHVGQLSLEDLVRESHGHDEHVHRHYETVEFSCEMPLHPRRLVEFLDNQPTGAYRIKGVARLGDRTVAVHTVGDHISLVSVARDLTGARLVVIGTHLDGGCITERLRDLVDDPPDPDIGRSMLVLGKYLR